MAPLLVWVTAVLMVVLAVCIAVSPAAAPRRRSAACSSIDGFARFAKVTILLSAAAVLVMSEGYMKRRGLLRFEYPLLVALAAVGMMIMVSAGDLMALYMGLELQSLALYVVASLRRDSVKSTEAGLKYFVLGALSSGLLLYGASLVYGYAGTTLFSGIIQTAQAGEVSLGLLFGLMFLIAGMAFKVSAVPFHMWTPDVYEGSPTPVTAFFATAPKVAAMALFARVLHDAFGDAVADWQQIVALMSLLSMFLGAFAAIGQTQHQAADGLFLDRPHGLCPDGAGGGHRAWRAGDADLHGDLCDHERRHLRLHPDDGEGRPAGRRYRLAEHVFEDASRARRWRCWCCCSRWRACRRCWASSASSTCCARPMRRGWPGLPSRA